MGETYAKCLTCGDQVIVKIKPIPYLFTCPACGPLPEPDPPLPGRCKAGHWDEAVYDTPRGILCRRHLAATVRVALWGL